MADYTAEYDDLTVERLKRAGAVIFGKTNLPEFGHKATTDNHSKRPRKGKIAGQAPAKKLSAIDAAAKVLASTSQPLSCKELIARMAAPDVRASRLGRVAYLIDKPLNSLVESPSTCGRLGSGSTRTRAPRSPAPCRSAPCPC
jgi:hypothetical protein